MWITDDNLRKWRSDSLEARVHASAEAEALANGQEESEAACTAMEAVFEVMAWLYSRTYADVAEMVAEKWGVSTSPAALNGFWRRFSSPWLAERMRRNATMANRLSGEMESGSLNEVSRELIGQQLFDLLSSPRPDPDDVVKLYRLIVQERKIDTDERKVALLEEKARKAEEAKAALAAATSAAKERGGLTEETLARIEEAAGLL